VKEAIKRNVPKGMVELNLTAFEKGYGYGKSLLKN
jgi:Pyruvate/2-oxoacid:ferredoxin oxidoreductase gamma subunit